MYVENFLFSVLFISSRHFTVSNESDGQLDQNSNYCVSPEIERNAIVTKKIAFFFIW